MKKNIVRIIGGIGGMIISISFVFAAPVYNPFADLPLNNPYFNDIVLLYKKGLVEGYADGSFKPGQLITRAEFVKLVLGAGECVDCANPPKNITTNYTTSPFPDVTQKAWYFYCVARGKEIGIVTGYLGNTDVNLGLFAPENPISRAESVAILLRSLGIPPATNDPMILQDVLDDAWYRDYVKIAVNLGILPYHSGFIAPEEKISRDEFSHLVNMSMNQKECKEIVRDASDDDKDGTPTYKDQCPTVPGPAENNGCPPPDRDGDTVFDNVDQCPDVAGTVKNKGCVDGFIGDEDGDNVLDTTDTCPTIPGPVSNKGCPLAKQNDRDGDGVSDPNDKCPDIAGPITNQGCPVISESKETGNDQCPKIAGKAKHHGGCPYGGPTDQDGDNVLDTTDTCPTIPGPVENHGCPLPPNNKNINATNANENKPTPPDNSNSNKDTNENENGNANNNSTMNINKNQNAPIDTDGDGIPDPIDTCPTIPGNLQNVTMNNGCPYVNDNANTSNTPIIIIVPPVCDKCPCPIIDYKAAIRPGDVLFSIISNANNQTIYTRSNPYTVTQ